MRFAGSTRMSRTFNPTLVRLRPSPGGSRAGARVDFQSHAGSIEALHDGLLGDAGEQLSIPRWFD